MRIIFGNYSFKIKSFETEDLNLDKETWGDAKFEVHQEVFHLFWIPIFGTGKLYKLRKNGELFEFPLTIIPVIKTKKVKTPWYAYFLPIAFVVGSIGFASFIFVMESKMRYESHSRDSELYAVSISNVEKKLPKLSPNAYLRIVNIEAPKNRDYALYLKVIETNDTIYKFKVFEAVIPHRSSEKYYWKQSRPDTVIATINELKKAVSIDYDAFKEKKVNGFNFFGDDKKYIIDQIEYFDGAVIDGHIDWDFWNTKRVRSFYYYNSQFNGYKDDRSWLFTLRFQNFGVPVNLIEIKNIKNEIDWVTSLPIYLNRYEYLRDTYVQGSTTTNPDELQFKSKFIFEDSLKNKYEFMIEGEEAKYIINRIE